jgi:tripartite ATP-independent transporter DctM subunit
MVFRTLMGKCLEWLVSLAMVVMVGVVFLQVVYRYIFSSPIAWSEEMARIIFVWITLLGTFLALRTKSHISIETFMNRFFTPGTRAYVSAVAGFLTLYYCVYLGAVGIIMMEKTVEDLTPVMLIPFSCLYAAIAVSGVVMAIYLLVQMYHMERKQLVVSCIVSLAVIGVLYLLFGRGGFSGGNLVLVTVVLLALFILSGMPIAFALGIGSALFFLLYQKIPLFVTHTRLFGGIDSFPLLAVPFFVLAGELMNIGGVTHRLVALARALVGHIRGGLGMVCVVAEYFFSGISGSTVADVSAIGALLIPAMKKAGYTSENSVAVVSAATAMGILVPPCIPMVVLGGMTGISVGALFMGGFLPAVVLSICIMILIYIQALRAKLPLEKRPSLRECLKAVSGAIIPLLLPVIILGGIISGAATPTEISVIAVLYAFIIGVFLYKEIKAKEIIPILTRTVILTGSVMFLVGNSSTLSWILSANQVPQRIGELITHLSTSPLVFLLLCNLTFILLGAVLEGLPAMLILVPIFLPFCSQFGINQIHFGILVVASLGIGLFLPPIGMGIYIACAFAEIDIGKSILPFLPYLACLVIGLLIISAFPWVTLVLPNMFFK